MQDGPCAGWLPVDLGLCLEGDEAVAVGVADADRIAVVVPLRTARKLRLTRQPTPQALVNAINAERWQFAKVSPGLSQIPRMISRQKKSVKSR